MIKSNLAFVFTVMFFYFIACAVRSFNQVGVRCPSLKWYSTSIYCSKVSSFVTLVVCSRFYIKQISMTIYLTTLESIRPVDYQTLLSV